MICSAHPRPCAALPDPPNDTGGYASLAVVSDEVQQVASYDWARRTLSFVQTVAPPKAVVAPPGPLQLIRQVGQVQFTLNGAGSLPEPEDLQFRWELPQDMLNQSGIPGGLIDRSLTVQYHGPPGQFEIRLVVVDAFQRQSVVTTSISVI